MEELKLLRKLRTFNTKYQMKKATLPDGSTDFYFITKDKKKVGKRICAAEDIFTAIKSAHNEKAHRRVAVTKNHIDSMYCNISEKMIKEFISSCPICNASNDAVTKKDKGPGIPIKSGQFRERFQVDLIDYQKCPAENHYGVSMSYLMVIKDHFTKFTWLRPIPRKEGKLVATELRLLFHEVSSHT